MGVSSLTAGSLQASSDVLEYVSYKQTFFKNQKSEEGREKTEGRMNGGRKRRE